MRQRAEEETEEKGAGAIFNDGLSVGIDLVAVDDVRRAVDDFGDHYLNRVFTPHEISCSPGAAEQQARHLAARFAAKEATFKVLGANDEMPPWRCIEVVRTGSGAITLSLSGRAAQLARDAGLSHLSVALTHEGPMAAAVVIASAPGGSAQ